MQPLSALSHEAATGPLRYEPAFDGLRAVAVLAVMAYHADLSWARGGFLGVDVFFVLSGFLITTLLTEEWQRTGAIRIGAFYARRALRLLPALFAIALVLNAYASTFVFPQHTSEVRRETAVMLMYASNWALVFQKISPIGFFSHTWSLAIEEQFYILWPLVLVAMFGRISRGVVIGVVASAAAGSALLRWLLWQGPESFSRIYHGSDTRAEALLIGAVLALLLLWRQLPESACARRILRAAAAAAVLVLLGLASQGVLTAPWTVRFGLSVAALSAALVIAEVHLAPEGLLARVLSVRPLVWVGRISYGLYLWHFPLFLIYAPRFMDVSPARLAALRFGATFAAAIVSYVLVELPFQRWKHRWSASR